jgi:hypothetical protein
VRSGGSSRLPSGTGVRLRRDSRNETHLERHRGRAGISRPGRPRARRGAGRAAVHPGNPQGHVPLPAVDDAAVRRFRHRRGDQPAVPRSAGRRPDGSLGRLRPPHPDGPGLRRAPGCGRGRQGRRRHRLPRRHAQAVRGDPARRGVDLDDHQRHGSDPAAPLPAGRRGAGGTGHRTAGHRPERHPQGVRGPGHLHLSAPAVDAPGHRPLRLRREGDPAVEHHLHQRLPHPGGGGHGGGGAGLHGS